MDFGKETEDPTMQKKVNEIDIVMLFISNLNHFLQPGTT